jgi:predicted DNA-binding transcriptional regulator AlpA
LISKVKDLKENSNLSITQIAKLTERSRATIYKLLKSELGYASDRLVKQGEINEAK